MLLIFIKFQVRSREKIARLFSSFIAQSNLNRFSSEFAQHMAQLPSLSCNVCGQLVISSEAFMTACGHLLCTKHGQSVSECPVCLASLSSGHLSSLDFAHQMTSREISLLRSIAIKAPSEISQLLVEANAFVLRQADYTNNVLRKKMDNMQQEVADVTLVAQQKNDQLKQQLNEVTREAQKSNSVLAELREDLHRVEQQQLSRTGIGIGGVGGVGGIGRALGNGNSNNRNGHGQTALVPHGHHHSAALRVQEVGDHQQLGSMMRNNLQDEQQQRFQQDTLRRETEQLEYRKQHQQQRQQEQQQERQLLQQQQQQQRQQQRQRQQQPRQTPGRGEGGGGNGVSSTYFTKPTGSTRSFQTPSRMNSSFSSRHNTPSSRRPVASRQSSSFVRARSVAGTPNSAYVRKSNTPRLDFKNVRNRVGSARLH